MKAADFKQLRERFARRMRYNPWRKRWICRIAKNVKVTLRQRRIIEEDLNARHMQVTWWETDSPETEIKAAVSFPEKVSRMAEMIENAENRVFVISSRQCGKTLAMRMALARESSSV